MVGKSFMSGKLDGRVAQFVWKFNDSMAPAVATALRNQWGEVIKVKFFLGERSRSYKLLCFPSGDGRDGWTAMGEGLLDMLGQAPMGEIDASTRLGRPTVGKFHVPPPPERVHVHHLKSMNQMLPQLRGIPGRQRQPRQHAPSQPVLFRPPGVNKPKKQSQHWIVREPVERNFKVIQVTKTSLPRVEIQSKKGIFNEVWWSLAVIGKPYGGRVDWKWAEEKIKFVFLEVEIRSLDNGEIMLFFDNVEEKEKILQMAPLSGIGGTIKFRPWEASEGSLPWIPVGEKLLCVALKGIPFHLRTEEVVREIAMACGGFVEVNDASLNFGCSEQRVRVGGSMALTTPRSVILAEEDKEFSIMVVPENSDLWGDKPWEWPEMDDRSMEEETDDEAEQPPVSNNQRIDGGERKLSYAEVVISSDNMGPPGFTNRDLENENFEIQNGETGSTQGSEVGQGSGVEVTPQQPIEVHHEMNRREQVEGGHDNDMIGPGHGSHVAIHGLKSGPRSKTKETSFVGRNSVIFWALCVVLIVFFICNLGRG
ncbi:hypothetical protein FRX31_006880 [Thalictrum thalictroides]|uniref:DUF4283 domain-containing protein n=1 Tax=Thalictrum thalictroides TaxID=46969 RepID=A0A7J6X1C2_THATH|nr:hypothetical protein FRX31_006880 [Thalictrum thalictroides]